MTAAIKANKSVQAVIQKGANYLFHLLAVAHVGSDSEYADEYRDSVLPEDITYLKGHANLLTFAEGEGDDLVSIWLFPAAFNLESTAALEEYFSLLNSGLSSGDFKPFFVRYNDQLHGFRIWFTIEEDMFRALTKYQEIVKELGRIVVRNHDTYDKSVWEVERQKILPVKVRIDEFFGQRDYVADWEKLTRLEFKSEDYSILLCSAIKNGPNANSLGNDKVVFYYGKPIEETLHFISHEIGSHLLVPTMLELGRSGKYDRKTLYAAFECLAKFYNTIILDRKDLAYQLPNFHEQEFLKIYDKKYHLGRGLPARDLLIYGLETLPDLKT